MSNISEEKRRQLIEKVNSIREFISNSEQDDNTRNLLKYISDIEKDIKRKKYGLVFEEHRESIDELLETHVPILTEEKDLFIDNGGNVNFLLEGDNLASLQLLEKTHKGKIDVIYIDPPYNTGKEFVYNDDIVSLSDGFRHSMWLSFMEKRLIIAKRLLSDNGCLFLSIDDNELAQVYMLLNDIFGEENFISNFCVIRAEGGGMAKQLIKGHDYCLVYAKNINKFTPLAKQKDVRGKIIEKDGKKYWIQEDWLRKEFGKYGNCHYEELIEYKGEDYKTEIDKGLENGLYVLIPKSNGMNIVGKLRLLETDSSKFYSVLKHLNKNGVNELKELGVNFDYPKPLALIEELISGATYFNRNAKVLDFFAGSGTTGHAVMKLNAEDGGNRKFILCTNNENNICRDITYQRIKKVIEKENYNASLKYMKVEYIPISDKLYYEFADDLLKCTKELVELENAINFDDNDTIKIILTNEELDELTSALPENVKTIYISHNVLTTGKQNELFENKGIEIHNIPDYYYKNLVG